MSRPFILSLILAVGATVVFTQAFGVLAPQRDRGDASTRRAPGDTKPFPVETASKIDTEKLAWESVEAEKETAPLSSVINAEAKLTISSTTIESPAAEGQDESASEKRKLAQSTQSLYPYDPIPFGVLNATSREALVNVFCNTLAGAPISGSGVIIDPRGIILTNAHVAQFVLLADSGQVNLSCVIRTGSPAFEKWRAEVVYMPLSWARDNADKLRAIQPTGTGERDFALLAIISDIDGKTATGPFNYLSPDTRANILSEADTVLAASYPSGFLGEIATYQSLYPASSITTIEDVFTFTETTVDLVSLGGIILAQTGSSGGAVVNNWGRLAGLIVTARNAETTSERDLRALTMEHIDRVLFAEENTTLEKFLSQSVPVIMENFAANNREELLGAFLDAIRD